MGIPGRRPAVTELRLSFFRSHRGTVLPLSPLTLLCGPSGTGKSAAVQACSALGRLAAGVPLEAVFPDPVACVPRWAQPDAGGRRGFRIGCTVDGPAGEVRLDLAVQAEPSLRVVGERLTGGGRVLLNTALRDPRRSVLYAEWPGPGPAPVIRASLPDDRLGTALLPLRVAGTSGPQRMLLAAVEQVLLALRPVFPCDPSPGAMRMPVAGSEGLLRSGCDNLAAVLHRTRTECGTRHGALVAALRAGYSGPVEDLLAVDCGPGLVRAVVDGGAAGRVPVDWLGDGELRYLGLALVLLTGPGVLDTDRVEEVLPARQTLTVLADGLDRGLDERQRVALLELAVRMCARGHIRLLGTVHDARDPRRFREAPGLSVLRLPTGTAEHPPEHPSEHPRGQWETATGEEAGLGGTRVE